MEEGYSGMESDAGGYKVEAGGVCYKNGSCKGGRNATREDIGIAIDGKRPVRFDWHTHGNEGRPRQSGIPGDMYTEGASGPDLGDAQMTYQNPVLKILGNTWPTYIIGANKIYRITPDANGAPVVTTFSRWTP